MTIFNLLTTINSVIKKYIVICIYKNYNTYLCTNLYINLIQSSNILYDFNIDSDGFDNRGKVGTAYARPDLDGRRLEKHMGTMGHIMVQCIKTNSCLVLIVAIQRFKHIFCNTNKF